MTDPIEARADEPMEGADDRRGALPVWAGAYAGLGDQDLAALANPGLVRRAHRLAATINLVTAGDDEIVLACDQVELRLLPGGPSTARCLCPVAGICVHIVAGCLWAAEATASITPNEPVESPRRSVANQDPNAQSSDASPNGAHPIEASAELVRVAEPVEGVDEPQRGTPPDDEHDTQSVSNARPTQSGRPDVIQSPQSGVGPVDEPAQAASTSQREAAGQVIAVIELLVAEGLSQVVRAGVDRLSRAGKRAQLDNLRLLARLVATATGLLERLARRVDDVSTSEVLSALAQAWANARAVHAGRLDTAAETETVPQRLVPLAVRWWRAPTGARGFTLHAWDPDARRLEQATNGRAAGTDPGFTRSWEAPLLWRESASRLSSGVLTLKGARRRDDGTLAAATSTTVTTGDWTGVDLDALADQVNAAGSGLARTGFGAVPERLRIILPRRNFGLGTLEVDEVAQQIVWPITDRAGERHRLTLPADEFNAQLLTWFVEESKVQAVVSIGDQLEAAFVPDRASLKLVSVTLTPLATRRIEASWRRRLLKLDKQRRASEPARELNGLERLCQTVTDVLTDLAANGRTQLGPHHTETLAQRQRELGDLGLHTLATATAALLDGVTPARLLWAQFVNDRVTTLAN